MIKFFESNPELLAVMSEREDGSMKLFDKNWNLGKKTDENRKKYFEKIKVGHNNVICAYLKNGIHAEIIKDNHLQIITETDSLVTKQKDLYLAVTVADCIPVYFYDSENKIIGLAHAGWRGIVGGVIKSTLDKIFELGGKAENIRVALGPGINKCHFEIKEDTLNRFNDYSEFIIRNGGKIFVDLKGIIKKQLIDSRIKPENIEDNSECTFESNRFFSFRRDKPKVVEAMIAIIGLIN